MTQPARNTAALALALVLLLASCWTVVPGPTLGTLALAVVMPEVAPVSLPIGALLTFAIARLARGPTRTWALILAVTADACLGWPLVPFLFVEHAAHVALSSAGFPDLGPRAGISVEVTRDVPVSLRDGGRLALDLYRPRIDGARPLLVTIYGGAWAFGSRAGDAPLARRYAAQGYAVAVIDYRHAPRYRFPTQIDDVEDALRAIASHARDWHIDPQRVALLGRSAGAQLALLAAERPQPLRVRAAIAYYAPTDLAGGWETPPRPDPAGVRSILAAYLGGSPDAERRAYDAAGPVNHVHAGIPPTLLIIGDRDELVLPRFQRSFAARLRDAGVRVVAFEIPWANHAFDTIDGLSSYIAHDATARFLAAELVRSVAGGRTIVGAVPARRSRSARDDAQYGGPRARP